MGAHRAGAPGQRLRRWPRQPGERSPTPLRCRSPGARSCDRAVADAQPPRGARAGLHHRVLSGPVAADRPPAHRRCTPPDRRRDRRSRTSTGTRRCTVRCASAPATRSPPRTTAGQQARSSLKQTDGGCSAATTRPCGPRRRRPASAALSASEPMRSDPARPGRPRRGRLSRRVGIAKHLEAMLRPPRGSDHPTRPLHADGGGAARRGGGARCVSRRRPESGARRA